MEAAIGSTGLAPPLADEHSGALDAAAGMAVDDGGGDGGQQSEEVASELRDQALGLISDAQTAGDRREKEALLKQVEELVLHRAPGLLDEVVPTLIAEFQVDPAPGVRKVLAEFLENVVKAHPSFCQPGMVDVYAHALQYDDSPLVVKRVLVAATNVHRVVLRYAAHSGLAQIWADYCRRVKAPVLAMRDDPVRMADPGIAQGVMKFLEGCIFTGSAPARSSAVASRADDSFTVADLAAAYDAQTQELFGVEGMRQEAQALLGQSLLGWLSRGHEGFKAPHWSFLINTLSSIATHRVHFLPLIAGTLGGLLAARFAPSSSEGGEEEAHGQHLRPPAVTQVLKSACLKLARLPATRSHPLALEALAKGLKAAGMEAELKALGPHLPEALRTRLLTEGEGGKEGAEEPASKRPRRGVQEAEASASASAARDPRQQRQRGKEQEAGQEEEEGKEVEVVVPPELLAVPPQWYKTNAPERAAFVLASLVAVPLPPAPFRDARLVLQDPDALMLRMANDLTGGQPQQSLFFFAEVAAGSRQEGPMEVSGGGLGNEALTELILEAPGSDDDDDENYAQRPSSLARHKAATAKGSGVIGEETLTAEQWGERRRLQGVGAVDRMLWRAEGAVDDFGVGPVRVAMVARVLCLLGGSAEMAEGGEGEEEVVQEGPTLPQQQVEGGERRKKANVAAIAALASTQGAMGHAISYLVEDYGSRKELADRLLYEMFLRGLMEQEEGEEEADAAATAVAGEGGETEADKEREKAIKKWGLEAEERRLRKGMELYDAVFVALCRRLVGRLDGRDKDKLLTSAYLSAPRTPTRALDLLSECLEDKTGNRMMQGLMTLVELAVYRPMVQEDCLARVLQAAVHANADVRRNAIQRAILKRLYRIEELKAGIEGFARAQLDSALQPPPAPAPSSTRSSKRSKSETTTMTKEEEEEDVKRRIYLYLSLCSKNEALVGGVFETYAAAASSAAASGEGEKARRGAVVRGVLEGEMDAFVKHVVVPHGPGPVLSSLVGAPPLASPLILLVLNLLAPETQARPRPPAPEVVAAAKSLRQLRGGDVAYLLPVLGGLTRQEMEKEALPPLMEQDLVDERLLKRMIVPYGPLSHADALVALHNVDPEQAKIPLKKYLDTLQKCLGMKALFPQTALTLALVKMVEDKATPVPYAYMRSVILAIRTYPGLKAAVADAIVPKLVEREIWATQPRVWEGMVLLPKYVGAREVTDKMAEALLLLPALQLQDLIKKNTDIRAVLVAHVTRAKKQAGLDAAKRKALGL